MYGLWGYLLKAKALAPINARRVLEGGWYLKITLRHIFRFRIDYFIVFLDCVLHVLIWSWCHEWLKITKPYNVIMQVHLFPATPFNHCRKRIVLVPSTDSWLADCAHWWGSLFFPFPSSTTAILLFSSTTTNTKFLLVFPPPDSYRSSSFSSSSTTTMLNLRPPHKKFHIDPK